MSQFLAVAVFFAAAPPEMTPPEMPPPVKTLHTLEDSLNYQCRWTKAQDLADVFKVLLTFTWFYTSDRVQTISITVDEKTNTLCCTGPPGKIALVKKLTEELDKPKNPNPQVFPPEPEFRKYPVPPGSAEAIAKTLQADNPSLRVIALPKTDEILVLATPEEHFHIKAKLATRPCADGTSNSDTAVIPVIVGDPEEVAKTLAKLFPSSAAGGPVIEPQVTAGQPAIIVKGTPQQIKEVRAAVEKIDGIREVAAPPEMPPPVKQFEPVPLLEDKPPLVIPLPHPVPVAKKVLTHIPLAVSDRKVMAEALAKLFPNSTVAPVRDEDAIIVYATEADTKDIIKAVEAIEGVKRSTAEKKYTLKMKDVPWKDVLEWFSNESGLTPIYTVRPTGKFTFTPPKPDTKYTLGEVIDILNEAMASQKFILVRRQVSFTIIPTDEKVDGGSPRYELSDLPRLGKTELVQILIPLKSLAVEDTMPEVQKMLTPFGTVSMLQKTNTLVVHDTAGNIARIVKTLADIEGVGDWEHGRSYRCRWTTAQDVANFIKVFLTLTGMGSATPAYDDPYRRELARIADKHRQVQTLSITVDAKTNTLSVTGPLDKILHIHALVAQLDKPKNPLDALPAEPALRKYPVPAGSAEAIAKKIQADLPDVRVIALQSSNEVLVLGTPEEHLDLARKLSEYQSGIEGKSEKK
jgi:type II secretory pathway component GspD/PulD (secretin)